MSRIKTRVVSCFLEYEGKFVILYRSQGKSFGHTWGLPAGKAEPEEENQGAILREIREETGYVAKYDDLELISHHISKLHGGIEFYVFRIKLNNHFEVICNLSEHESFKWVTPKECASMPDLIPGLNQLLVRVGHSID